MYHILSHTDYPSPLTRIAGKALSTIRTQIHHVVTYGAARAFPRGAKPTEGRRERRRGRREAGLSRCNTRGHSCSSHAQIPFARAHVRVRYFGLALVSTELSSVISISARIHAYRRKYRSGCCRGLYWCRGAANRKSDRAGRILSLMHRFGQMPPFSFPRAPVLLARAWPC